MTKNTVGILGYGSIINNPKEEIKNVTVDCKHVCTPFNVEFARVSGVKKNRRRGGAPTLVPVPGRFGKKVKGKIFEVKLCKEKAAYLLYCREGGKENKVQIYREYNLGNLSIEQYEDNDIRIINITDFEGFDDVVFVQLGTNIEKIHAKINLLTAKHLACLAIISVKHACPSYDGITYLMDAESSGIETDLSLEYKKEILRMTGNSSCLSEALSRVKGDEQRYLDLATNDLQLIQRGITC